MKLSKNGCPANWTFTNPSETISEKDKQQVVFCTSHVMPGIEFSDDRLLQDRNFPYLDTQNTRLGINWE